MYICLTLISPSSSITTILINFIVLRFLHKLGSLKCWSALCGSEGKVSACDAGDPGSISGSGTSPGEGNDNPLQYSCLENH